MYRLSFSLAVAALATTACAAQTPAAAATPAPAQTPENVVDAFHADLDSGDGAAALALLDDKVLIFEGGGAERSKAEYATNHLGADSEFSKATKSEITRRMVDVGPDMAVVASEGRTTGEFRGRKIDNVSAETMVLRRGPSGWRIIHIHWSSGE